MSHENPEGMFARSKIELGNFKVGDKVKHPLRDEDVAIEFLGTEIYLFILKANAEEHARSGRRLGGYEAIEGSEQFNTIEQQGNFIKKFLRSQPSAEIDFSNDIEHRTLVVPLEKLTKTG